MLINYDDEINKIIQVRKGKRIEGLTLDIPEIDEYLRFKPSNFNLILGHANTGKTTVTLFLMLLYSVKHKIKWLVFSSENEPHTIIKKLIEFLSVQPINKIPTDQFDNNAAFIFDHFKFIDPNDLYTYKQLLHLGKVVKDAWDYQGFLIDPYNSLLKDRQLLDGLNGHEYDYEATSEIRQFCKKNQTSIWLTTHAATFATRIKHPIQHDYAGHPIPPLASDVEGGGKFVNRADDFMVIHRYIQHPTEWMINHIHIRKVKDTDTGGRPTPIDKPIMMKSIKNNVGFEINGKKTLNLALVEQINAPF
jgi:hypothetical protein|tara:strand:+ start:1140 stop:2054 length:915 start_codon:yes stop_codon:yes gene_type:complete